MDFDIFYVTTSILIFTTIYPLHKEIEKLKLCACFENYNGLQMSNIFY